MTEGFPMAGEGFFCSPKSVKLLTLSN